jgi:hypothetical protein
MAVIYRAENVNEAIQYASYLKMNGRHDWFRGQVSQPRGPSADPAEQSFMAEDRSAVSVDNFA